jgi:hypothetical protein
MAGLGLEDFLNYDNSGGRRSFLKWKKDGKATIWLAVNANYAYAAHVHNFPEIRSVKPKRDEEGEEHDELWTSRFVSPDSEEINKSQHFRDDDGFLKIAPRLDPFLLLREWLRHECDLPLDAPIFEFVDPVKGTTERWTRGVLARLMKGGRKEWNHDLSSKLEYTFLAVANASPADGVQIVRGPKLLGDKVRRMIKNEIESNPGGQGDPKKFPYAIRWTYDENAKSPMDSYDSSRFNAAPLTEAIREAINTPADKLPDVEQDMTPRPGDKARIRAAMESAAVVDLPWDRIFVPAWVNESRNDDDEAEERPARTPNVETKKSVQQTQQTQQKPAVVQQTKPAESTTQVGQSRRKKAEPPKVVEPERIKCDDCDYMMLLTDAVCAGCGAKYIVDGPDQTSTQSTPQAAATTGEVEGDCFSCGSGKVIGGQCQNCGIQTSSVLD